MIENYIIALFVSYLGLVGGFIVKKFAKEELNVISKKSIWFIHRSEFVYALFAVIFYLMIPSDFFESTAAMIFLYGVAVGTIKDQSYSQILLRNSAFLIIGIVLLLTKSL